MFFKSNISNFSKATLILENGDIFPCLGIGSKAKLPGSFVLILQWQDIKKLYPILLMPHKFWCLHFHIGITGVNNEDIENKKIFLNGVIFRELSNHYSNWRSLKSLIMVNSK